MIAKTFPLFIEPRDGQFSASVVGGAGAALRSTFRDEAIAALREALAQKIESGELVNVELTPVGVSGLPHENTQILQR